MLPFGTVWDSSLSQHSAAPWDGCSHTTAPEALCSSKGLRAPKMHGPGGHRGCKGLLGSELLLEPSFHAGFLSSEQITAAAVKTNSPILHNGKPNPQPLTAHLFLGLAGAEKKKKTTSLLPSSWVPAELWHFPAVGQDLASTHLLFPSSHSLYGQAHTIPGPGLGLLLSAKALRAAGISFWGIFPRKHGGQHRVSAW